MKRIFNVPISASYQKLFFGVVFTFLCIIFVLRIAHVQRPKFHANEHDEGLTNDNNNKYASSKRHILSHVKNDTQEHLRYAANVHYWDFVCGYSVEDLRSHPLFPFSPFRRDVTDVLHLRITDKELGARVFGYLHPPADGFYTFVISSDDSSEFWLSSSEDPLKVELIAKVAGTGKEWSYENQFDKYPQQKSMEIKLKANHRYYFDILWKQERARGHLQVAWKRPFSSRYEDIGKRFISKYYDDSFIENGLVYMDHLKGNLLLTDLPSHVKQFTKDQAKLLNERSTPYQRDSAEFISLPHIEYEEVSQVLPECDYDPSWIIPKGSEKAKNLGEFEGIHMPHYFNITTSLYPEDQTWNHTSECLGDSLQPVHCKGNDVLHQNPAKWVINKYMAALKKHLPGRFNLHTIVNVEESKDEGKGDRYLLELALDDTEMKIVRRFSMFLYRPKHGNSLCYPKGFQWTKDVMVHLILTVKNQGSWVQQYIESLSNIYVKTKDKRFNLIITDFESFDIDLEETLRRSPLPNWQVVHKTGKFHKTSAISDAIDAIKDPNSITLQTDLHLEFPINFIDDTRKHCVQGRMGYTPLLMRLACGRYSHKPAGFWEALGYGIFGLYKSDWDSIGGMDLEKFKNAWGGEDWDFGDRVIKGGLEIERLRVPYFFHYFHTKKGMWDNKY